MATSSNHTSATLSNKSMAYFDKWRTELLKDNQLMRPSDLSVARLVEMLIDFREDRLQLNAKEKKS